LPLRPKVGDRLLDGPHVLHFCRHAAPTREVTRAGAQPFKG
jgi:hypothetical protein